ncbi:alpha/beta fold hydrolase [Aquibacillus albus]|uniref:Alpha-beta hydrolase superfamily lysophospholipase n=1 Tax=Aquibacillus albus TaxID=1168171 RepID=A0ABS2MYR0_9BACI|nr:alpha/beta hydrolase [Aquibacillus albus]MBM7571040.1 alpha-beta hydrolase superfamily lysophospholipase [Aquibacillus albus]
MNKENYWLTMRDGHSIYMQKWEDSSLEPKGLIQIAHGMVDHINRYDNFATYFAKKGYIVYGNDHRGHGKTGQKYDTIGFSSNENGFERMSEDLVEITQNITNSYPTLPIFLLGHSFGSFLVRYYIQSHSEMLAGVILSGTGHQPTVILKLLKQLAKREIKKKGAKTPSHRLNKLIFGNYERTVPGAQTNFDWLSRDRSEVKKYIDDPHTGFIPSTTFYFDMFHGMSLMAKNRNIAQIKKNLPMLFISGDQDPVGNKSKGVKQAITQYQKHEMENIEYIFYEKSRHEVLNEINKQQVYDDINQWIGKIIEQ